MIVATVFAFVIVVAALAWATSPTADERQRELQADIASCRELGGEPRLEYFRGERFILKECWLSK